MIKSMPIKRQDDNEIIDILHKREMQHYPSPQFSLDQRNRANAIVEVLFNY